jgi:hypothetical protein
MGTILMGTIDNRCKCTDEFGRLSVCLGDRTIEEEICCMMISEVMHYLTKFVTI